MRLADLPRGENRAILQRLYNGNPPFDPDKMEENNRQINRNFLEGPNLLTQARRQWNNAMIKPGNYFSVKLDSGPVHKRRKWGHIITTGINRELKRCNAQTSQVRGTGAQLMLHGIGPTVFDNRKCPIPKCIPISSVMIPSETEIDMDNLSYIAFFREMTPAQLYGLTHGAKVDPGWNMKMVNQKIIEVRDQIQKEPNATAYQYMPERIEEMIKQDMGFWGSDAVPTIDYWDFYFREGEDGDGWYRRTILDWGVSEYSKDNPPTFKNAFLYTSEHRKFCNYLSEIFQCNFGDTSAVAPFRYHSVRSLGWMLWGVCDLQNRLRCQFSEAVFEQLMWFFRTSSLQEFNRVKKAMFTHFGAIPPGIAFVTANDRFKPDANLINLQLDQNRQLMSENAAAYTQPGKNEKEMSATEVMADMQSVNSMVMGILNLAYEYEKPKQVEQCRRFCIKNSPYAMVKRFRLYCLENEVPPEMLDHERWIVEPERVLGGGNKIMEIAQAGQLQGLRKNLGPDAQRKVDHIAIEVYTDDPALAEDLAPVEGEKKLSASAHDAQLATDRILRGLKFETSDDMIPEDYVKVWLGDLGTLVNKYVQAGGMANPEELAGLANLATHIHNELDAMASNKDDHERVKQYGEVLSKLTNYIKAFQQRQQQAAQAAARKNGQGRGGIDPKDMAKVQGMQMIAAAKAKNLSESHAQRASFKQVEFEQRQQREEREHRRDFRQDAENRLLELAGQPPRGPFEQ
jgi:hypothetical protein